MDSVFGEIIKCGIFDTDIEFPSVKKTKERTLTNFEIELFISHNGTSIIDNKSIKPKSNTLLLAKPNQKRMSFLGFKCFYLHINLPTESKYYDKLINCPDYYVAINPEKYRAVFESLIYYHNVKNYNTEKEIIQAKIMELVFYLYNDKKYNSNIENINSDKNKLGNIIEYINNHYDQKLDLNVLAEKINYSKNYFQTVFKSVFGLSPKEFITKERITHAKEMLNDSSISLIDISYLCGFSSQSYFNYVFKKETNLTPLEYRRKITSVYPIK